MNAELAEQRAALAESVARFAQREIAPQYRGMQRGIPGAREVRIGAPVHEKRGEFTVATVGGQYQGAGAVGRGQLADAQIVVRSGSETAITGLNCSTLKHAGGAEIHPQTFSWHFIEYQPVKQNITVSKTSPGSVNLNVEGVVADDIVKSSN